MMVKITENLIRKRAEHNNLEISTLEELSLHQQDIERIEHIDKWCRDLRILYLQSNLIPKIENVGRLKKLEYLNLALNNIERIENLEGCESLQKLDLTVNFIGELTSIECLRDLVHFEELFLTGNPCTEYEGFRKYVIATLPGLKRLDGAEIDKSERIKALQELHEIKPQIIIQQEQYRKKREKEKLEAEKGKERQDGDGENGRWYTDINAGDSKTESHSDVDTKRIEEIKDEDGDNDEFWKEKTAYTPESRVAVHEHLEKQRRKQDKKDDRSQEKRKVRLESDDGRKLNVNQAKMDFSLIDDEDENQFLLEVSCYKHLDTSLMDVDVQPTHVKVVIKGKVLQLVLAEEVKPDSSTAQRSQTTGHLLITMPKMKEVITRTNSKVNRAEKELHHTGTCDLRTRPEREFLEVDPAAAKNIDLIVNNENKPRRERTTLKEVKEKPVSEAFVDDPDVPPLI
ncbi:dynein axonemal assembly factor 11-like [Apostichopus japonicus]|uniref:dynein axonemal assembly factor 11-like n=1 Tax=Stichopus japonicus TaxID=307972 RepID=UPI003AB2213B